MAVLGASVKCERMGEGLETLGMDFSHCSLIYSICLCWREIPAFNLLFNFLLLQTWFIGNIKSVTFGYDFCLLILSASHPLLSRLW